MVIIPLPLFGAKTVFGVRGFESWVVIGIIWTFCSIFAVVIYPLYESREALLKVSKGLIKVLLPPFLMQFLSLDTYHRTFLAAGRVNSTLRHVASTRPNSWRSWSD